MKPKFQSVPITERVHWVGAIDWELRDFHGYATLRGSTYNAFLILGEKNVLIDTVKAPFRDELIGRIQSLIELKEIDYIVSNHSEMDHSGCLTEIMDMVQPERVFASAKGVEALEAHFGIGNRLEKIEKGMRVELGEGALSFMETRMVHWPDSMFTYYDQDQVLFSNDAFGMHLASNERFDDQLPGDILYEETAKYYANILLPMSPMVLKVMKAVKTLGEVKIIAPDHGPVWQTKLNDVLEWYETWAARKLKRKAVIFYDTMWGSTASLARVINEGLLSGDVESVLLPLKETQRAEVAFQVLDAAALIVGSPNLNGGVFPTVADVLTYLQGLNPKTPIGAVFGSYGWSDKVMRKLSEWLTAMKVDIVTAPVASNYVPGEMDFDAARKLGQTVAEKIREIV